MQPARAAGLLGFDIGLAATAVNVDTRSTYWRHAVGSDFTTGGYVALPRIVVSKGFSVASVSAMYAKVSDTGIKTYGGALDVPIISGGLASPTLALRGSYATLSGVDVFDLKTYGAELFLSKGIGPVTPYGAIGRMRVDGRGTIPATTRTPSVTLSDRSDMNRYTVGVRLSFFIPKIVIEATQAEVRSYSAKVSLGL